MVYRICALLSSYCKAISLSRSPLGTGRGYGEDVTMEFLEVVHNGTTYKGGQYTNAPSTGARVGPKLIGQPINQGVKQSEWIMAKHRPNQLSKYAGKSRFNISSQAELQALIRDAFHMPMTIQPGGNVLRTVNAGRIIGFDALTGKLTSIYSVITNPKTDNLITAFPGLP